VWKEGSLSAEVRKVFDFLVLRQGMTPFKCLPHYFIVLEANKSVTRLARELAGERRATRLIASFLKTQICEDFSFSIGTNLRIIFNFLSKS